MEDTYANNNCSYTVEQLLETCREELELLRSILLYNGIDDDVEVHRLFGKK